MFLLDDTSQFKLVHRPSVTPQIGDLLFVYQENKIALTSQHRLPVVNQEISSLNQAYCFGYMHEQQCLLLDNDILNIDILKNYQFIEARRSHQFLEKEYFTAVGIGNHVHHFRNTHRFCGQCGALTLDKMDEQALICSSCTRVMYPKISPCAIVLITRGEEILLARSPHFLPNVMSLLAGFVGIGETVEQTVVREVKEEVSIEIGNIQYICSQPWPFPDALMLGYTAKWVSGEIKIDNHEIEQAAWFHKDNLPLLPNKMSIARYLIDRFLE